LWTTILPEGIQRLEGKYCGVGVSGAVQGVRGKVGREKAGKHEEGPKGPGI